MNALNEKIKEILAIKEISPSHFADEIGVQRSSISHILSGRNKPSFDIIQKIMRRYPDLGTDWFLEHTAMESNSIGTPVENSEVYTEKKKISNPKKQSIAAIQTSDIAANKEIERILVFYKDKTFSEYMPS
jgi:transcriptional regulator with XRE-family HTH domain